MSTDIWTFACALYARPDVETACLALQDAGADVCLLLAGLWLDRRGTPHDANLEMQLRQISVPWQKDVVEPLRQLRQSWRSSAQQDSVLAELRRRVKQLEQDAEQEQLLRLETLAQGWPQQPGSLQRDWLNALAQTSPIAAREACDQLYAASLPAP